MKKDIVVFGVGGFGREIMESLRIQNLNSNQYNILGFIVDDINLQNEIVNSFKIVGTSKFILDREKDIYVLVCVGDPILRKKIVDRISINPNVKFPNFIADGVCVNLDLIAMGNGNIICCGNILTVNIKLGDHNHINLSNTVGHDTVLGNYVTVSPGCNVSGNVHLDDFSYIGTGTVIRQGLNIGENTTIGMGSVVTKNIENNVVAFGNPCKVFNIKE